MEECPDDALPSVLKWFMAPRNLTKEPMLERVTIGDPLVLGAFAYRMAYVIYYCGTLVWIDQCKYRASKLSLMRGMMAA